MSAPAKGTSNQSDNSVYSPNPNAPVPHGMQRGLLPGQTSDETKPAGPQAAPPPEREAPGLAHVVAQKVNQNIAELLGIPGSAAAHLWAPKVWNEMEPEIKDKLRRENPRESAFMDWVSRSAKTTEETVGQTGMLKLFDKLGFTEPGAEPVTPLEHAFGAGGEMAASMVIPGLGEEAMLAKAWKESTVMIDGMKALTRNFFTKEAAPVLGSGAHGSNAVGGFAAGVAGEEARQNAPDRLKPLAEGSAQLAGGITGALGTTFLEKMFGAVGINLRKLVEGAETRAARRIDAVPGAREDINRVATEEPAVAGSQPTTFQATGNDKLGMLEADAKKTEYGKLAFLQREEENNAARMTQVRALRDPAAGPDDVTSYLKQKLEDITDSHAAAVGEAMEKARASHEMLGGEAGANPSEYGERVRGVISDINKEADRAEGKLWDAAMADKSTRVDTDLLKSTNRTIAFNVGRYAKQPEGEEAEIRGIIGDLGKTISFGDMVDIRSRITDRLREMRAGVNPNRREAMRLSRTLQSVDNTLLNSVKMTAEKEGPRSAMIDKLEAAATAQDAQLAAREGTGVEARAAANEAGGEPGAGPGTSTAVGRVPEGEVPPGARGAGEEGERPGIDEGGQGVQEPKVKLGKDSFTIGELHQAQQEFDTNYEEVSAKLKAAMESKDQAAVKAASKELTRLERYQGRLDDAMSDAMDAHGFKSDKEVEEYVAKQKADRANVVELPERPTEKVAGPTRVESPGNTQLVGPSVNDNTSGSSTAENYASARAATAARKSTYERGVIGGVLRPNGDGGYRMMASNVMRNVFDSPERLDALIKAGTVGDKLHPDIEEQIKDYAAFSMKKAAGKEAGTINPTKLQDWVDKHEYVFERFPDLRAKFADVKSSQAALEQAVQNQKSALKKFQTKAVSRLIHYDVPPVDVVKRTIGTPEFEGVTMQVAHDPEAKAGWRAAVADHIVDLATSVKEAGTSGEKLVKGDALEKFLSNPAVRSDLGMVFSPEELASIDAVAKDFRLGQRKMGPTPAKVGGGSMLRRFAADWIGGELGRAAGHAMGGYVGGMAGEAVGIAAAEGGRAVANRKETATKEALADLLLNPKKAALALEAIPKGVDWKDWAAPFNRRMGALSAAEVQEEMKRHAGEE